jgi:hypothetical protein
MELGSVTLKNKQSTHTHLSTQDVGCEEATKVCGGALRVSERVLGVRVRVNAHRGTAGMMTHQEKLARGRAILAAYRACVCVVAVRGAARCG